MRDYLLRALLSLNSPHCPASRNRISSTETAISARPLKDAVDGATTLFNGYDQRDSHEFISAMLCIVHDKTAGIERGEGGDRSKTSSKRPEVKDEVEERDEGLEDGDDEE